MSKLTIHTVHLSMVERVVIEHHSCSGGCLTLIHP